MPSLFKSTPFTVIIGASYCSAAAGFTGVAHCTGVGAARLIAVAREMYSTTVSCAVFIVGAGSAMLTAGALRTCSTKAAGVPCKTWRNVLHDGDCLGKLPAGAGEMMRHKPQELEKCSPRQGPAQHTLLEQEMTLVASKRSIAAVLLRCLLYSTVQYLASLVVAMKSAIAVLLSFLQLAL